MGQPLTGFPGAVGAGAGAAGAGASAVTVVTAVDMRGCTWLRMISTRAVRPSLR